MLSKPRYYQLESNLIRVPGSAEVHPNLSPNPKLNNNILS